MPITNAEIFSLRPLVPVYAIEDEEFHTTVRKPQVYTFPNLPSRANWASYLIDDFAFSAGLPEIQQARHAWMYLNLGFDYVTSEVAFSVSDGLFALSRRERKMVKDAFSAVNQHYANGLVYNLTYQSLSNDIDSLLEEVRTTDPGKDLPFSPQDLLGLPAKEAKRLFLRERRRLKDEKAKRYEDLPNGGRALKPEYRMTKWS